MGFSKIMKKYLQQKEEQNTKEEENSTDKKNISTEKNRFGKQQSTPNAATNNKLITKIIRKKSTNWNHFKTMLKRVTCLVMLLALLLLIFTCYTEGKKGNNKKKLSEQEKDKVAEKLAKHMSKESKLESEEAESEETESEETVEYIEGTTLRKPPKNNRKRLEKRAKEFMQMHNSDGSIAAAWERLTDTVKDDDEMLGLAKEIKKTYKITEDIPQGERMEKMMTMLQEKNINKIADSIGNKFTGDEQVQKILKTIQPGFKVGSKNKKDEKKPKGKKDNTTSKKYVKADKKENSEKKHKKYPKEKKANSKKTEKNVERKGILKDSEKSTNTITQTNNDKMNKKNDFKNEFKGKAGKSQEIKATIPESTTEYNNQKAVTSEDKNTLLNNLEYKPIKRSSCEIDESKTNENSHVYKNAQSECNAQLNDNINPGADAEENKIPFSRFQDSVNFNTKKDVFDSGIESEAYQTAINNPHSHGNQKRGDMGEKLSPIHSSHSSKMNQGDMGENIIPIDSHNSHSKQSHGDAGDNLSPLSNPPIPSKQRRGDTGETLSHTNNPSPHSKQNRGETSENLTPNINSPSSGMRTPSEQTHLPSDIPSLQDVGDKPFNSFPGKGSLPEKVPEIRNDKANILEDKQRAEPTSRDKSKEKHWTGQGYDFNNKEPMGPPSEKKEGKLGKLSKDLPLFSLLSSREDRTKGNTQRKAKVSRRVARGDTGSVDNMMESLQDHGGWNAARGRK